MHPHRRDTACVCVCVSVCVRVHVRVHVRIYTQTRSNESNKYIHTYIHAYVLRGALQYINILVRAHTHTSTYTYSQTHTHTEAQYDGQVLHGEIHKNQNMDLPIKVARNETIIQVLRTIGYERFPNSGESLVGDGVIVLTQDNVYFYHKGFKATAEANQEL
jgi:hypothetical protein